VANKSENFTVIGLQWGDEGKGKIVDALANVCRYVARFCGGANAGHTVTVGTEKFALHLIPCGILHDGVLNVVGNGVVFDPGEALEELDALAERGISVGPDKLRVSSAAQMVMPWHKLFDGLSETALGKAKIGTTARGIGPCYADKASRSVGIRAGALKDADSLAQRIRQVGQVKNRILSAVYGQDELDIEAIVREYTEYSRKLAPMVCNTGAILRNATAAGERILFEGGQGSLLDIDHGTYPFVTSSSVTACGVSPGAGVPPVAVGRVVGVLKAYTTRVGAGPFPTEQNNEIGQYLRDRGNEYGTTTGRPRRCGHLDAFAARYTAALSGVDELALTLFDVLSGLDELKICRGYRVDGREQDTFDPDCMDRAEPIYETLPGWQEDISGCKSFEDLPQAAKGYVQRVEEVVGCPVGIVSVGKERSQTLRHKTSLPGLQ